MARGGTAPVRLEHPRFSLVGLPLDFGRCEHRARRRNPLTRVCLPFHPPVCFDVPLSLPPYSVLPDNRAAPVPPPRAAAVPMTGGACSDHLGEGEREARAEKKKKEKGVVPPLGVFVKSTRPSQARVWSKLRPPEAHTGSEAKKFTTTGAL